jgi:cytochrome c5
MPRTPERGILRAATRRMMRLVLLQPIVLATLGACERTTPRSATADSAAGPAASTTSFEPASAEVAAALAPPPPRALTERLATEDRASMARIPPGAGHDVVVSACVSCHSVSLLEQQHKDTTGWSKTVTQMIAWGAPVPGARRAELVAYLAERYPARAEGPAPRSLP